MANQNDTQTGARSLPTVQTSDYVTEILPPERFKNKQERNFKSPSPKIVRFSKIDETLTPKIMLMKRLKMMMILLMSNL